MSVQFFGTRSNGGVSVVLPKAYHARVRWLPRIGDIFPDFSATSTHGPLGFHDWAGGKWVYFFSHPAAFTPVCTTELAHLALNANEFDARGVKLLTVSRDTRAEQFDWAKDIRQIFGADIRFPMISDQSGIIASICGMLHPKEDGHLPVRKSFLIDPSLRVRMIFEYPMRVGRCTDEVLRVIDALQTVDAEDVATPAGWEKGDPCLVGPELGNAQTSRRYGTRWWKVRDYLKFVTLKGEPQP